jgi:2-polyprenyl-3-methyl-5-hydroxy-6-metoxy-1,4-benzoquinol methylase
MNSAPGPTTLPSTRDWVPETAFGKWFLSTHTWRRYVLSEAITDLKKLAGDSASRAGCLLDIGCGQGVAFPLLVEHFQPASMLGVDVDTRQVAKAERAAQSCPCPTTVLRASVTALDQAGLAEGSVDVIFCHQLIHHLARQEVGLAQLYRLLPPGGVLMLSESCEAFINSWSIRLLFRHPAGVQKSAAQYVALVRAAGFEVADREVQTSVPWWSLPDLGIRRRLGWQRGPLAATELLLIARKPR